MQPSFAREPTRFFHPVLPARKLREKPVRVLLGGRGYVLFRDAHGAPAALDDACAHRLAPLSAGHVRPDGRLACPYHGWHFGPDGRGRSPSQPSLSRCDVRAYRVEEHRGYLFLGPRDASGGAAAAPPDLADRDGYTYVGAFSTPFRAPLHVALDNFSENEHTPWVHTRLGWDEAQVASLQFEAHNLEDRTEVHYKALQRPSPLLGLLRLERGDFFHNDWVTRFDPVRSEYTIWWSDPAGAPRPFGTRVMIYMVPETERTTWFHSFVFFKLFNPAYRPLLPAARLAALALGWWEVRDDAQFIPTVADTPFEFRGMRLGRFDKPLIHNHKLLRALYYGEAARAETEPAPAG